MAVVVMPHGRSLDPGKLREEGARAVRTPLLPFGRGSHVAQSGGGCHLARAWGLGVWSLQLDWCFEMNQLKPRPWPTIGTGLSELVCTSPCGLRVTSC